MPKFLLNIISLIMSFFGGIGNVDFIQKVDSFLGVKRRKNLFSLTTRNYLSPGQVVRKGVETTEVRSLGAITITITRDSADIARALPVPLFMSSRQKDSGTEVCTPYFAVSTDTISSADGYHYVSSASNSLLKTVAYNYQDSGAANTDIITVACTQGANYRTLLSLLDSGQTIRVGKMKVKVSSTSHVSQFDQAFNYIVTTALGGESKNQLVPNHYYSSNQQQQDIIEIDQPFEISASKGFVVPIIAAGFTLTLELTVTGWSGPN